MHLILLLLLFYLPSLETQDIIFEFDFYLSFTIQVGTRKVLLSVVSTTWSDISLLMKSNTSARSPLLRKFLVKLSQRIGLTCLPRRLQSWRYQVCQFISLFSNDTCLVY